MNKQDFRLLAFYRGQEIIKHPISGMWILTGEIENEDGKHQVICKNNIGTPEEDCDMFFIDEIQFSLKPIHKSLLKRCSDSVRFIKHKADEGCWVGDQKIL